jgi:DegV family protein with EDD domain
MAKIKLTCDSTCDLGPVLIQKHDVHVIPLYINFEEKSYRDGVDLSPLDLFDLVKQKNTLPKTAAVSVEDYIELFRPYLEQGYEVIHINISSKMSACHQNALLAAKELESLGKVYPIDSYNLSSGSGHLVLEAAELAKEGKSGEEIRQALIQKAKLLEVSFCIDTLEYLHKGGRCSSVAALGANLLKLRPCIEVKDGEMGVGKKYRGKMDKALMDYVTDRLSGRDDIDLKRIFITHTYAPDEIVELVREAILKLQPFQEIIETKASCTISSHCGKGTLGILFFKKG